MIFGNWRPGGILTGSLMFGYTDSLRLRSTSAVHALLLLVAIGLIAFASAAVQAPADDPGTVFAGAGAAVPGCGSCSTDAVPREFTGMTPYVATLLVLAFAAQRLRMPKADGQVYRKGSAG